MKRSEKFNREDYGGALRRLGIGFLLLLLVVGLNIGVNLLPDEVTAIDCYGAHAEALSQETTEKVSAITAQIELYLIGEEGKIEKPVEKTVEAYQALNPSIRVAVLDPAFEAEKIEEYVGEQKIEASSVLVASNGRAQCLQYHDFCRDGAFVLEEYLNKAIAYVTSEKLHKVYALTGHGERELSQNAISFMGLDGFSYVPLDLMKAGEIPADAALVLANGLEQDVTKEEAALLQQYLSGGGNLLLATDYTENAMPNLSTVTQYYGATLGNGLIVETGEGKYFQDNQTYILPYIYADAAPLLTEGVEYVLTPNAKPILLDAHTDAVNSTVLLRTSEEAYTSYTNLFTGKKEETVGPFNVGVALCGEGQKAGKLIWFSTAYLAEDTVDAYMEGSNMTLFLNAVCWLADQEEASIYGRAVSQQYLLVSNAMLNGMKIGAIFLLPGAILLAGAVVLIRRRRR